MSSPVNARLVQDRMMAMGRFAAQAGRSRFNVNYEYQKRCEGTPLNVGTEGCHNRGEDWVGLGTTTQSPEATGTAARGYFEWPFHLTQAQWTMPLNNQLLFDASVTFFRYNPAFGFPPPDGITNLIPVTEQSARAGVHQRESGVAASRLHRGKRGDAALGAAGQLRLPRARAVGLRRGRDQQLQRGRVVRHRFAQHQGGIPAGTGCVSSTRPSPRRTSSPTASTRACPIA